MARGLDSNNVYTENDILNNLLYPKMRSEPLVDDDDCIVIPVRNRERPHFRRMGLPSFANRLGRAEKNPTHDKCVDELNKQLSDSSKHPIQFSTYVFSDGAYDEQILFSSPKDSDYGWFKEAHARVGFHDGIYIQPDLAGTDRKKFFPRSAYPNIIIEVIRTHYPEMETLKRLIELSQTNYYIFFYFIGENKQQSTINHYNHKSGNFKMRVSHYIIGGKLYKNGELSPKNQDHQSFDDLYKYLKNSYFKYAIEKA